MKKRILTLLVGCFTLSMSYAQPDVKDILEQLGKMPDQFDRVYNISEVEDKLTLIYIPGTNEPFQKFYMKKKATQLKENVILVGGFKEMMNMMSADSKRSHLQEALAMRYKEDSKILIDVNSELGALLSLKGYTIITISKKKNKILKIEEFGFDRVKFFQELKKYETSLTQ